MARKQYEISDAQQEKIDEQTKTDKFIERLAKENDKTYEEQEAIIKSMSDDEKAKFKNETYAKWKRADFIRLAESRTNKVIDSVRVLSNLSNKSNYAYTQSEVDEIFDAVYTAVDEAKAQFNPTDATTAENKFKLSTTV